MPLLTRTLKGSKLTIEEMDGNLTYLENLAISQLRNYVQLQDKPLIIDNLDRWNTTKEFVFSNHHLYINGPFGIRFSNHIDESGTNYLIRAWEWDGPLGASSTPYRNQELTYFERLQINFTKEEPEKSMMNLKTFDWSGGTESGVEYSYKFYQGGVILPYNTNPPSDIDGCIAFSDGNFWDPTGTGQPDLNVRMGGEWKRINLGIGITGPEGPIGPSGPIGPQGEAGVATIITNFGNQKLILSDGSESGLYAEDDIQYDGSVMTLDGDLVVLGIVDQPTISSPTINDPVINNPSLSGGISLGNFLTTLIDTIIVTEPVIELDFSLGREFYIINPLNDFGVNIVNVPDDNSYVSRLIVYLSQDTETFSLTELSIDSELIPIKWLNSIPPTPLPTLVTRYEFTLIRTNNEWRDVLGNGENYGGS